MDFGKILDPFWDFTLNTMNRFGKSGLMTVFNIWLVESGHMYLIFAQEDLPKPEKIIKGHSRPIKAKKAIQGHQRPMMAKSSKII